MPERYTPAYWEHLEKLVQQSDVVIDRAEGESHPTYTDMVYPLDYGYLAGTTSADGGGIDVFVGAGGGSKPVALACTIDLTKRDAEIKILLDCTEAEMKVIIDFLNQSDGMYALLVRRED